MSKPVLFLLKLFNDTDQQAPVIWKMASRGYPVRVLFLDKNVNLDIRENPHLRFLATFPNCRIDYYYALKESRFRLPNRPLLNSSNPVLLKFVRGFIAFMRKTVWTGRWMNRILREINPSILAAECEVPKAGSFEADWFREARRLGIPLLGLPHSPSVYHNFDVKDPRLERPVRDYRLVWPEMRAFDYIVLSTEYEKAMWLSQGFSRPDRLIVKGSPRFCPEWREVNRSILEPFRPGKSAQGKLRVVFFIPHFGPHVDHKRTLETVQALAGLDFIYLAVKEQTRQGAGQLTAAQRARLGQEDHAEIIESQKVMSTADWIRRGFSSRRDFKIESSVSLIRWADAVICYSSSIGIEAVSQNKLLINPVYLYTYASIYEALGACMEVRSLNELIAALRAGKEGLSAPPYSAERFAETVIYGGQKTRDVLGSFENLILRLSGETAKLTVDGTPATMSSSVTGTGV